MAKTEIGTYISIISDLCDTIASGLVDYSNGREDPQRIRNTAKELKKASDKMVSEHGFECDVIMLSLKLEGIIWFGLNVSNVDFFRSKRIYIDVSMTIREIKRKSLETFFE